MIEFLFTVNANESICRFFSKKFKRSIIAVLKNFGRILKLLGLRCNTCKCETAGIGGCLLWQTDMQDIYLKGKRVKILRMYVLQNKKLEQ